MVSTLLFRASRVVIEPNIIDGCSKTLVSPSRSDKSWLVGGRFGLVPWRRLRLLRLCRRLSAESGGRRCSLVVLGLRGDGHYGAQRSAA